MDDVSLISLSRVRDPVPNQGGSVVLAYFDCVARGIAINGCAFVRTSRGGLTVWPPRLTGPEATRRSVTFVDSPLRQHLTNLAQQGYQALGGTDGGWVPRAEADQTARN